MLSVAATIENNITVDVASLFGAVDIPGTIPNHFDWSEEKHGAFTDLGVDDVYREETYLAALISSNGFVPGSKVDVEAIAMDKGTSSRKRYALQEVQDETPTYDHLNGHLSQ
ncbi:hypothetical protein ACH5RR_032856 [Cinchona calisaya]|uniref:Uncharacterized protein n=1 Tax=Cinchona calisaya TaxID=153742 RepID=A0ABD2YNI8_9GENT